MRAVVRRVSRRECPHKPSELVARPRGNRPACVEDAPLREKHVEHRRDHVGVVLEELDGAPDDVEELPPDHTRRVQRIRCCYNPPQKVSQWRGRAQLLRHLKQLQAVQQKLQRKLDCRERGSTLTHKGMVCNGCD